VSGPTVASLAAEVAELRNAVADLAARVDRVARLREILDDAGLPAPPPRLARRRRGLRLVKDR
jgi:hypothetical protein